MDVNPGQIVLSKAGRDKGKKFMVLSVDIEDGYVHMADGNLRKVENPKKKKLRHLVLTGIEIEKLALKIKEGKPLQNSEIYKEIKLLDLDETF
ncbi:MAG: KOW domain-containing RNA-binding protein [Clostridia bacterium]|nr:KOW domain-containing RNA-binding protein [Clostridia bacterium]